MGTGGRGDRPIGTMEAGDECIKVGPLFFRFPRGFSLHLSKFSQRTVGVWFRTCCAFLRFVPDGLRRQSYQKGLATGLVLVARMADRETHAAAAVSTGQVGDASGRGDANEANEVVLVGEDEAKALFDDLCGTLPPRGKVGDGLVHGPKRFLVLFFVPAFSFFGHVSRAHGSACSSAVSTGSPRRGPKRWFPNENCDPRWLVAWWRKKKKKKREGKKGAVMGSVCNLSGRGSSHPVSPSALPWTPLFCALPSSDNFALHDATTREGAWGVLATILSQSGPHGTAITQAQAVCRCACDV